MSTTCSQCGGTDIEYDQSRGDAVCTGCGCVLEDNIIVSEVTFAEKSSGASSVVGQFVSSEGSKVHLGGTGFRHGMAKDSREITIAQAKKRISDLGHMLKLNQHCIDSALMFFKMALQMNLTRGRKSSIIDTACLYLVCRSEGTPHLLLDFSDVLQINVYSLGRAYLRLANALHIRPPAIDPCLYIHRFAHKLELGDKTHDVSMTALRLVARMKRDWIHHGRRPAGLCGAALLVSSRLHNFNRSVREVARVVKLSEGTLRKRLGDFKDTASSRLTIDEFLKIDLEQEHDPPSYLEGKRKAKQKGLTSEGEGEESGGEEEEEEEEEEDSAGGFSGIRNHSVDEIIAKARFTESFLTMSAASVGLTDNLEELARLGEEEEEEEEGPDSELDEGVLCTADIDDSEIEQMLLSEEEVKIKSQLWFAENGDFLKERELKREKLAQEKAEKDKNKKNRPRGKRPKVPQQQQTYNNAGEAIGKMLVEKRISTKLNYDVLRDIEIDSGHQTFGRVPQAPDELDVDQTSSVSNGAASGDLTITRTPLQPRLPSLTSRKRDFSSLGGLSSFSSRPSHPLTVSARSVDSSSIKRTKFAPAVMPPNSLEQMNQAVQSLVGSRDAGSCDLTSASCDLDVLPVVEESGPVEYCEEEEEDGLDDDEIEDLAYEDDPLLAHSDTEDYDGDY